MVEKRSNDQENHISNTILLIGYAIRTAIRDLQRHRLNLIRYIGSLKT